MSKKVKKTERASQPAVNVVINKVVRGSKLLLLLGMISFTYLALFTSDLTDNAWSFVSSMDRVVSNAGGIFGAWLSDGAFCLAGYFAFILPLLLGYLGWMRIFYVAGDKLAARLQGVGFILLCLTGPVLAERYLPVHHLPFTAGGIVGSLLKNYAICYLGSLGTSFVVFTLFFLGLSCFFGSDWLKIVDYTGEVTLWCFKKLRFMGRNKKETQLMEIQAREIGNDRNIRVRPNSIRRERPKKTVRPSTAEWVFPAVDLLDEPDKPAVNYAGAKDLDKVARNVELRLRDFGIKVEVVGSYAGPVVTRFELQLAAGTKVSRITILAKDLARSLSVPSVRVVEVIPGKSVVGLELPNEHREIVRLREIISSAIYEQSQAPLTLALGKDISGYPVIVDLAKMPHLLVAGTTGSGKSVCVNALILSLLYKYTPQELRLILIDPKMLELSVYAEIPHLLAPVITDMNETSSVFHWCVLEMERRYRLMSALGVRNLAGYNQKIREAKSKGTVLINPLQPESEEGLTVLPYLVLIADEYADMMMVVGKKIEELIARLAQKARAAGIHLILATQRPSVDVVTGLIKANIPSRIAFQVSSKIDSRTILDQSGADQLLGHGDMLYLAPGSGIPTRVHGAFVSDDEVHRVVRALKQNGKPEYLNEITAADLGMLGEEALEIDEVAEQDVLYDQAVQLVIDTQRASTSLIQRRFKIGYNRAARIVEAMEFAGLVGPLEKNGSRTVLVSK